MEANYPYDIKNQRGASKITLVRGILPELVLYGIRLLAPASLGKVWTNESAVLWELDQWEWRTVPERPWAGGGPSDSQSRPTCGHTV